MRSEPEKAHFVALSGILDKQYGQSFVVAGVSAFFGPSRVTERTIR